jgi:hypothetical protein
MNDSVVSGMQSHEIQFTEMARSTPHIRVPLVESTMILYRMAKEPEKPRVPSRAIVDPQQRWTITCDNLCDCGHSVLRASVAKSADGELHHASTAQAIDVAGDDARDRVDCDRDEPDRGDPR